MLTPKETPPQKKSFLSRELYVLIENCRKLEHQLFYLLKKISQYRFLPLVRLSGVKCSWLYVSAICKRG